MYTACSLEVRACNLMYHAIYLTLLSRKAFYFEVFFDKLLLFLFVCLWLIILISLNDCGNFFHNVNSIFDRLCGTLGINVLMLLASKLGISRATTIIAPYFNKQTIPG